MHIHDELLAYLNDEQKQAVTHREGPLLIIAGAGTGKTTVITCRIAWLILSGKCKPEEILALTFTEKASGEMEERVDRLLPYGYVNLWISTFHAFCQRILEQHGLDIGIPNSFKLLDTTSAWLLVRKNFARFALDYYRPRGNPTKFIHALLQHFSRAKDEGILPEDYINYAMGLRLSTDAEVDGAARNDDVRRAEEIANAYHVYQQLLLENSVLDFGDLLIYTRELFTNRPAVLERYRKQFQYMLVDEFQDTNWVQYEIVKLLAKPKNNLTVVGDDDQCIFRWRGASYHNIIQFKKDYPQSAEVFLTKNYRSCQNILDCAYQFIQQNNPDRLECQLGEFVVPALIATKGPLGRMPLTELTQKRTLSKRLQACHSKHGAIEHTHCGTLEEESDWVCKKIIELKNNAPELEWSDISILVRANDSARPFIERLAEADVPYAVLSLKGLYSKPAVLDMLAYCGAVIRPHDSIALWRVLNFPFRAFSPSTTIALSHYAHKMSISLYEACQKSVLIPDIPHSDRTALKSLCAELEKLNALARVKPAPEAFLTSVRENGYLTHLKDGETEEKREALKYLDVLYRKIRDIAAEMQDSRLADVLEIIWLLQEAGEQGSMPRQEDDSPDAVHILTCHSAKGLEFKHVFIVNMVDRRFPTAERQEAIVLPQALLKEIIPKGDAHLEEERRLFYVALTRAKSGVYVTSSDDYGGSRKKKPSRFLHEAGIEKLVSSPNFGISMLKGGRHQEQKFGLDTNFANFASIPSVFSYSQLAAFNKCPLQYKFCFILKIPVFGKPSLSFGRTLHICLQRFFQKILELASKNQQVLFINPKQEYTNGTVKIPQIETLLSLYDLAWVDEWFFSKRQKEEYREHGREILKRMHAELLENPPTPKSLERDFTIKVGEGTEQYTIKGRIDRVDVQKDDTVEIIDYKTGTPKSLLTSEDKEQLLYYQIASEEVFGEKPSKLTYYYLDDGTSVSFIGSDADKEKLKVKAAKAIANIKKSDFAAKPGWHCKFCDFRDICEYRKL